MKKQPNKMWSDSLCQLTREMIDNLEVSPTDGFLHMKNIEGGYATISLHDLMQTRFRLVDKRNAEIVSEFKTLDELLEAGWAVD